MSYPEQEHAICTYICHWFNGKMFFWFSRIALMENLATMKSSYREIEWTHFSGDRRSGIVCVIGKTSTNSIYSNYHSKYLRDIPITTSDKRKLCQEKSIGCLIAFVTKVTVKWWMCVRVCAWAIQQYRGECRELCVPIEHSTNTVYVHECYTHSMYGLLLLVIYHKCILFYIYKAFIKNVYESRIYFHEWI